jgi:acetyl-CoA carboxylase carboxyltransferase component
MASDPYFYGGAWPADTCRKVERFIDIAQTFHLPVAYLVDCPGFLIGLDAEKAGTIKEGVRVMSAMWQTTIPWCAIIVRNSFGVAGAAHRNQSRYCMRYAWPSGRWGSLPLEGGIEAAAVPVPLGRDVLDRGDRGPARHASAALRVREPRRAAAPVRPVAPSDPPVRPL